MRKTAATSEKIMAMAPLGRRRSDIRDRALLLLGFAGAFRRSELVGLTLSKATQRRVGAPPYSAAMSPRARDGSE
jgi:site-specific recombinase XerD